MTSRRLLLALALFSAGFVFGQEDVKVDEIVAVIRKSEESTRREILEGFPDDQVKLTQLLNEMRDKGALSFDESKILYVARDKTGQTLFSHFLTLVYVEVAAVDEKSKLSSFWRDVVILADLLALEREEILDIFFMNGMERIGLLRDAHRLTVGSDQKIADLTMKRMKDKPLLKKRILDFMEGAHTRTRQKARELYTEPPKQIVRPPVADLRTWASKDGQFKIEAAYRGFEKGIVKLEKADYTTLDVHLDKLSAEDRSFVQKAVRDAKKK